MNLKSPSKLEPYEIATQVIPDELMEPMKPPEILPNLIENPIIMPDVNQELLELMQEPPISIEKSDRFEFLKPGLLLTQGKIKGHA